MSTVRLAALSLFAIAAIGNGGSGKQSGNSMAAIRIELFSDYQCPACKELHDQTIKPLRADYVSKGKVFLIHREFPLPMHQYAREAACYACAAEKIGKYEAVGDALFAAQESWTKTGKVDETATSVLTPAEAKKVRELVKSKEIMDEVEQETALGHERKVTQTPTMILTHNGKTYPVAGVVSYGILRRFIDQLIGQ